MRRRGTANQTGDRTRRKQTGEPRHLFRNGICPAGIPEGMRGRIWPHERLDTGREKTVPAGASRGRPDAGVIGQWRATHSSKPKMTIGIRNSIK
jgi:hypothetical protein